MPVQIRRWRYSVQLGVLQKWIPGETNIKKGKKISFNQQLENAGQEMYWQQKELIRFCSGESIYVAYMLAYLALEKASEDLMTSTSDNSARVVVKIEKMVKQFKTH